MKRVKTAVVGTGFMGRVHLEALRRVEHVEVIAVVGRTAESARKLADAYDVPLATDDYAELLKNPELDAVHICTPNAQHYPMTKAAIEAKKNVLCEKPVAMSAKEAEELAALAEKVKVRNCVCHNLRFYPMVQQMRRMREAGELGEILVAQGTYSQDWLLYDTDWNWRVDEAASGASRAMADIGSHWFDSIEHITGLRVSSLCADLQIFHPTRKRPKRSVESFTGKLPTAEDVDEVPVKTEDFGAVIFRLGDSARGAMTASQVNAGRKNGLSLEVYGTKSSVAWNQERPDELWIGHRNTPNQIIIKDPSLLLPAAARYADLPGGHSEGYDDTFKQVFRRFYASIFDPSAPVEYPQITDGLRQMRVLEAVLESSRTRTWTSPK
ncbi:Gfo/Idh/MocA family protein [Edaphobacter albus]|uniref:Gfo/Idh/MocA family protein n=1 Tax=Edaphobacter sp. 4G125 TaxID=2763071 RepID=UPI00164407EB|nr:Gfo/Idh/MocA family oxidoreductase [Edaphobacter sp. 4G125]QNI38262.1 Gfo/Idh/MocA family oxidoreductase [Edaphobacter sp. 4G125]